MVERRRGFGWAALAVASLVLGCGSSASSAGAGAGDGGAGGAGGGGGGGGGAGPLGVQHWHGTLAVDGGASGAFAMTDEATAAGVSGIAVLWQSDTSPNGVAPLDVGEVSGSLTSFTVTKGASSVTFTGTLASSRLTGTFADASGDFHGTFDLASVAPAAGGPSLPASASTAFTQDFDGTWTPSSGATPANAHLAFMTEDAHAFFATWAGHFDGIAIDSAGSVLVTGYAPPGGTATMLLVAHHDGGNAALATIDSVQSAPFGLAGRVDVVDGTSARQSGTFTLATK